MGNFTLDRIEKLLASGAIAIPEVILRYYSELNITETQLVIILQILRLREKESLKFPSVDKISEYMIIDRETVKINIANLMEKGIIHIKTDEKGISEYKIDGLYKKIAEVLKNKETIQPQINLTLSSTVKKIYPLFEKEFARPLTPMETSQILEWCEGDGYRTELILEALKRSVLRGVLNFRYIDTILKQWQKNGITTAKEAANYEQRIKEQRQASGHASKEKAVNEKKATNKKKSKYKDLYLNWGG